MSLIHSREAMKDTMAYIKREWPDIGDVRGCAQYVLRNETKHSIDDMCCFFFRHEGD